MKRLHKSEAQSNAEALARRTATYADDHVQSVMRVRQGFVPKDLREFVKVLREKYAEEVPTRLHEGFAHIGEGGTPKYTAAFLRYLTASDNAVVERLPRNDADGNAYDPAIELGEYVTPFRACLSGMARNESESMRRQARIVTHIVIGNVGAHDAALMEGAHPCDARDAALTACRVFYRRLSDIRMDLAKTETTA